MPTPFPRPSSKICNNRSTDDIPYEYNVLTPHDNITEKVKFLQAAMGYPTKSTILIVVKKSNPASFPGRITDKQIKQHYPSMEPSVKGHLTQERQGVKSTTVYTITTGTSLSPTSASNDDVPARIPRNTYSLFVHYIQSTGKIFGDPTGRFIEPSSSGNNYILIVYSYDSNTIHPVAMPYRSKQSLVIAYTTVTSLLESKGMTPKLTTLDNETSELLLTSLVSSDIEINLVPPYFHRRNTVKWAI